jgi:diacylglycerol kinase (ATP)
MRIALVANPASGSGTDVAALEHLLRARGARVHTLLLGDLPETVDAERVVVAGGDGSVGPAAALAAASGAPLAVIPAGTANDFARHLNLPLDPDDAAGVALDPRASLRRIDLGRADARPFVNAASAGLSVDAARAAIPLKRVAGALAYSAGAVTAAATGEPLRCRITRDGETCFEGEAWQVTVAGTGAFGGGAELEAADPADGELDVAVLVAGPRTRLARHGQGLRRGDVTEQEGVRHLRGCRITVEGPADWNVDGEPCTLGHHGPASFGVEPGAVRVVTPR